MSKPLAWRVEQRPITDPPSPWRHHSTHPRMSTAARVVQQTKRFRERRMVPLVAAQGERDDQ